ncbi:orotidine-5'-phosphate decarboxylase [Mariprofundus micogutta]|uniref:Orotidine 5'-phosphate decarboxylase n=1 Tax=Mariprofundus micogutta TaxID=1921010 RepID=A0A1L8CLI6_9PROT|nr:orotidine-5'-phosphate decarboxylase [Mariprofundus micogutta]GAV19772.1 orotidine-5'-phosphate decarboxylase [Mariprofundus micogutta]
MPDNRMKDRLMVALDVNHRDAALAMRDQLGDSVGWLKVGLRLFVAEGPELVRDLNTSHKLFLDLKFHDIPNTVAQAVESAGGLGVDMINVHAGGGEEMLASAAKAAANFPDMKLIAVTVLTSDPMPKEQARVVALERAKLAHDAGLDGIVCSVHEAAAIKQTCGTNFITVTPGIRWGGQDTQDQKRVADPASAITGGSDYLVVGRPILHAPNPRDAALEALAMMESVTA